MRSLRYVGDEGKRLVATCVEGFQEFELCEAMKIGFWRAICFAARTVSEMWLLFRASESRHHVRSAAQTCIECSARSIRFTQFASIVDETIPFGKTISNHVSNDASEHLLASTRARPQPTTVPVHLSLTVGNHNLGSQSDCYLNRHERIDESPLGAMNELTKLQG